MGTLQLREFGFPTTLQSDRLGSAGAPRLPWEFLAGPLSVWRTAMVPSQTPIPVCPWNMRVEPYCGRYLIGQFRNAAAMIAAAGGETGRGGATLTELFAGAAQGGDEAAFCRVTQGGHCPCGDRSGDILDCAADRREPSLAADVLALFEQPAEGAAVARFRAQAPTDQALLSERQWRVVAGQFALSRRELQIVQRVAEGKKDSAIARRLGISAHAVHAHLNRLFVKLGVDSRMELIALILRGFIARSA